MEIIKPAVLPLSVPGDTSGDVSIDNCGTEALAPPNTCLLFSGGGGGCIGYCYLCPENCTKIN